MSLAAQKFIAGAIHDAMQVHARRQKQPPARLKEAGYDVKDKRPVLLTEDLAEAFLEVHPLMTGKLCPMILRCSPSDQCLKVCCCALA